MALAFSVLLHQILNVVHTLCPNVGCLNFRLSALAFLLISRNWEKNNVISNSAHIKHTMEWRGGPVFPLTVERYGLIFEWLGLIISFSRWARFHTDERSTCIVDAFW